MAEELDSVRADRMLRQAEPAGRAFLDAITDEVAVLDSSGRIIAVNEAWKHFAESNGDTSLTRTGVGHNYLDVCEAAAKAGDEDAAKAADGLRSVLRRGSEHFEMEYECSSDHERRWFVFTATALTNMPGALVFHRNTTARRKAEDALRLGGQIEVSRPMFEAFLPALVKNLAAALSVRHAFLAEVVDQSRGRARFLSHWAGAGYGDPLEYELVGTPCEQVLAGRLCVFPNGVQKLFPEDDWLEQVGAESYMGVPLFDSAGTVMGHLGVIDSEPMEDIPFAETTLRMFAARATPEMRSRRAERRLADQSRLIENVPEAIIGLDQDFLITYWNKAAEKTYGWRSEEALGQNARELLHSEWTNEEWEALLNSPLAEGEFRGYVIQQRKDGSRVEVDATGIRLGDDDDGGVRGFITITRDITERLEASRALQQAELRARAIIEAIPDMILTLDGRGRFLSYSSGIDIQPLLPPLDFLGKRIDDVLPSEPAQVIMNAIQAALRSGQPQTVEYQLMKEGEVRDFEGRLVPLNDDEVLAVVRDYTAQKRQEREVSVRQVGRGPHSGIRSGEKPRVLVVDGDDRILRFLKRFLEESGRRPVMTGDRIEATRLVDLEPPDLLLLDVALFQGEGRSLFRELRRLSDAPIVPLGRADQSDEAVQALDMGADDYITKPFSPAELEARIAVALRGRHKPVAPAARRYEFGDLVVDPVNRLVSVAGDPITLTPTEYRILLELAESAGRVLTHDEILDRAWGRGYAGDHELLRSFIRSLRRKLGDDARHPRYVVAERGVGYRLVKAA